jgi:ABC-2 type transport system ATP-binding protein
VTGLDSAQIGQIAAQAGIALIDLTPQQASLEEAFMEITRDAVEFTTPHESLVGAEGTSR